MNNRTTRETFSIISERLLSLFGEAALSYYGQDAGKLAAIEKEAIAIVCHPDLWDLNDSQYNVLHTLCCRIESRDFTFMA